MKKSILFLVFCLTSIALAQTGLKGGSDGLHQQNAFTLGQWSLSAGFGGSLATDNFYMVKDGQYSYPNGKKVNLDLISPSFSTNIHLALGLLDFLDVGVLLPLHLDMVNPTYKKSAHLDGGAMGDLEFWAKYRIPFAKDDFFQLAFMLGATAPTGKKGVGMHPREVWYINSWGNTDPYTANQWALLGNMIFTLDFTKKEVPLRWNTNLGFAAPFNEGANTLVWATGLNYIASAYTDLFFEVSGETRVEKTAIPREVLDDPFRFTPGVRFHLPSNFDLALGIDVGLNAFSNISYKYNKENAYPVKRTKYGETIRYEVVSTPHIAASAVLTWNLKFTSKDSDGDGVPDEIDQCARTPEGVPVDSVGCPLDSDKDGIIDYLDKCPNTPEGVQVDSTGCPSDIDKDGVPDYLDKCPNTKEGVEVDAEGCPMDADKDGVPDEKDKCPNTPIAAIVDDEGCPLDSDKDGVPDYLDKCPNTPAGFPVDSVGCTLDTDKDGVPDYLDKCPNTATGIPVDSTGCPRDTDKDGVPDHLDKCPNTAAGISVDSNGCPIDSDKDGVHDHLDKCPNTLEGVKVDSVGCPIDKKQDLSQLNKGINFKTGSNKLTNASYATLDDIVALLRQIPSANLEVQGHTDKTGSDKINLKLSQARAQTVVDYFVKKGIDSKRVRAIGYGSERPIADNATKEGRDQNRRVELIPFESVD